MSKTTRIRNLIVLTLSLMLLIWMGKSILLPGKKAQPQLILPTDQPTIRSDIAGFTRATGPRPLIFPGDFGPHPDYQTEWWYYTGNLDTPEGRHFGYQLTFFRRALMPPTETPKRTSDWATDQVYMAHFALTDVADERYQAFQRFSRGAAGLAGAQAPPYLVWLDDWQVAQTAPGQYHINAEQDGVGIDLQLTDLKAPVLEGDQGYSQKGPERGNASYYVSQTRLATAGSVSLNSPGDQEKKIIVQGSSWMDHEYSTSALSTGQIGWDWFALQLDVAGEQRQPIELMVYQIRRDDGTPDPFSSGTLVLADGSPVHLNQPDFTITVEDVWRSPHSHAVYPSRWKIQLPASGTDLEIQPFLADQELNLRYTYWEGAVKVQGRYQGLPVSGVGYVELTGYAGPMNGDF
jgi:predicted secreted hydrolase